MTNLMSFISLLYICRSICSIFCASQYTHKKWQGPTIDIQTLGLVFGSTNHRMASLFSEFDSFDC